MNRRISSKYPVWRMHEETTEHVGSSLKVFIWLILPLSLAYFFGCQLIFNENVWAPTAWAISVYFYSNFLPDLPSIYRKKKDQQETSDLVWYKKYTLLLFAPVLVWLLFSGIRLNWRTEDTYHNFTSLAIYGAFLFVAGFIGFAGIPLLAMDFTKVLFFAFCGIAGFLTHLKVDEIWLKPKTHLQTRLTTSALEKTMLCLRVEHVN